jgi:integrase
MDTKKVPTGIEQNGKHIRVAFMVKKKRYSKTFGDLNWLNKSHRAAALTLRNEGKARVALGHSPWKDDVAPKSLLLLSDAIDRFIAKKKVSATTMKDYRKHLKNIWLPALKNRIVADLITEEIEEVLDDMAELSLHYRRNVKGSLSSLFTFLRLPNPCNDIKFEAEDKIKEQDSYEPDERYSLIEAASGQDEVLIALAISTGLRPGELFGLQWADWDGVSLNVRRQIVDGGEGFIVKNKTKTYHKRYVYVPEAVRPLLNSHVTRFQKGWIFLNTKGEPIMGRAWIIKRMKALHEKAGVRYRRLYICRHTRASEFISTGVHYGEAADQLGHSPQMFLTIYADFLAAYSGKRDLSHLEGAGITRPVAEIGAEKGDLP